MRNVSRFSLMLIASVLLLLSQPHTAESAEHLPPLRKSPVLVAEKRFVDNGDGTVTDTRQKIMWQKGDNGKEVTFEEAQKYCMTLRVGGYTDWRLPNPDERDTAVVLELMMRRHSRDVYAFFDLYWSSDPTVLLPFNYSPSYGKEVSRVYPTPKKRAKGFVRAVRSLRTDRPDSGS